MFILFSWNEVIVQPFNFVYIASVWVCSQSSENRYISYIRYNK